MASTSDTIQSPDAVNLVSGAGDCNLNFWSLNSETPLSVLKGHKDRVCRVAFHPSGEYVASASFDTSWRLWDVASSKELLLQEGHSKEVYSVEFQNDGALVASGYQIATGSGDDTIRIWDMRSIRALYTIPAHTSNVADVRFFYGDDLSFKSTITSIAAAPEVTMEEMETEKANADGYGDGDTSNDKKQNETWRKNGNIVPVSISLVRDMTGSSRYGAQTIGNFFGHCRPMQER
ncbi:U4/U6 snRNP-specific spliceosomal protein [Salix suchowensis]|nr:U4/U6 snRNP-specific spliceosomal protein [Salix suchowensis]